MASRTLGLFRMLEHWSLAFQQHPVPIRRLRRPCHGCDTIHCLSENSSLTSLPGESAVEPGRRGAPAQGNQDEGAWTATRFMRKAAARGADQMEPGHKEYEKEMEEPNYRG